MEKVDWDYLSGNKNAIEILKENPEKINWNHLSSNENGIELLKDNLEKINWIRISSNPLAIELIKENLEKIDWELLSLNPSIFTYDYELIKKKNQDVNEEIIIKALHPRRILRLIEEYGEEEIYKCFFDEE